MLKKEKKEPTYPYAYILMVLSMLSSIKQT